MSILYDFKRLFLKNFLLFVFFIKCSFFKKLKVCYLFYCLYISNRYLWFLKVQTKKLFVGTNKYKKKSCVRNYSTKKPYIKHEGWCYYDINIHFEYDLEKYFINTFLETRKHSNISIIEEQHNFFVFYDLHTQEKINSLLFFTVREEYYFYSYKKNEMYIIYLVCFLEEDDLLSTNKEFQFTIYYFLPVEIEEYFRSIKKASYIMNKIYSPLEEQSNYLLSKKQFKKYTSWFWPKDKYKCMQTTTKKTKKKK